MVFSVFAIFFTTVAGASASLLGLIEGLADFSCPKNKRCYAFGAHQALDKAGAVLGPLVAYALLSWCWVPFRINRPVSVRSNTDLDQPAPIRRAGTAVTA
jgi:hypothetical protein